MIVLKYNFNTVFINMYNNVFMSKIFWAISFGGQIFFPSSVNRPALLFWKAIHNLLQLYTYKNISRRVNWFNKLSYKNKCISGLYYFLNSPVWRSVQLVDTTLQAGDLIDQVDRERGANRNQSRGIQLIHAKQLTHHPNTRYTLLVMYSCPHIISESLT